jgi:hypothetical protein
VAGGVLRLTKAQLDGSAADTRYSEDFFIDLIFAPISALATESISTINNNATVLPEAAEVDKYESSIHKDARFWESVAQRKLRSKKRRARKFLASQQDQFSIADDSKILVDHDAMTEINFVALDKTESEKNLQSYQQDIDLIKQLAELEGGGSDNSIVTSGTDLISIPIASSQVKDSAEVVPPQTPKQAGNVKVELQALEDLEKELGLSDLHLFSNEKKTKQTTPKPTPSKNYDADDDNLDELEKYLQSLSGTPAST